MSLSVGSRTMARSIACAANKPLAQYRLRRLIAVDPGPYRLSLGSLNLAKQGWIPTDISWRCPFFLDVTKPWPFSDGSVSHSYGDNMVEHLTLAGARQFFSHALRALMPDGVLRLATPNIGALTDMYVSRDPRAQAILQRSAEIGLVAEHPVDLLRVAFAEHGHHLGYLWDESTISTELRAAGFTRVDFWPVGESDDADLRGLESRTDEASRISQLVVEARP